MTCSRLFHPVGHPPGRTPTRPPGRGPAARGDVPGATLGLRRGDVNPRARKGLSLRPPNAAPTPGRRQPPNGRGDVGATSIWSLR